jgi:hypothetical protein
MLGSAEILQLATQIKVPMTKQHEKSLAKNGQRHKDQA